MSGHQLVANIQTAIVQTLYVGHYQLELLLSDCTL